MAKNLRFGNMIFCEYAGRGEGGKSTLLNIYSGDILVSTFPALLLFSFYVECYPGNDSPLKVNIVIRKNGVDFAKVEPEIMPTKEGEPAVIMIQQISMTFDGPSLLEFKIAAPEFVVKPTFKKAIRLNGG